MSRDYASISLADILMGMEEKEEAEQAPMNEAKNLLMNLANYAGAEFEDEGKAVELINTALKAVKGELGPIPTEQLLKAKGLPNEELLRFFSFWQKSMGGGFMTKILETAIKQYLEIKEQ